jgi:SNF2 family DNA or RNA helicase
MKDYQLTGLSFLAWMHINGMNCILGDEYVLALDIYAAFI